MLVAERPLPADPAILAVSPAAVWYAGMLLPGAITSLPEIATAGTASRTGNPGLAVSNLLGSAAANILLLAVADAVIGRDREERRGREGEADTGHGSLAPQPAGTATVPGSLQGRKSTGPGAG